MLEPTWPETAEELSCQIIDIDDLTKVLTAKLDAASDSDQRKKYDLQLTELCLMRRLWARDLARKEQAA